MIFGVVSLSILVRGLTVSPLLRWLGIVRGRQERAAYELTRGNLQALYAPLAELDRMSQVHFTNEEVMANLRHGYEQKIELNKAALDELHLEKEHLHTEELQWAHRHLLLVEKDKVMEPFRNGILSQPVYEKLLVDIDSPLFPLESDQTDESTAEP